MCEISIIIPVYNKQKYIAKTLESVLDQTFRDFEILLINDGSTDGSGMVCDNLASSDARIKVFHTQNRGVSAARNLGIREATGKYISFIDADDCIDKSFLEKLRNSIIENDSGLAVCGYEEIRNGERSVHIHKDLHTGNVVYDALRQDLLCILWNKLYVREKIRHFFDESISTCEDSIFCALYYIDNDPKISFVDEPLYHYIVRAGGLTSRIRHGAFDGIKKLLRINLEISGKITDEQLKHRAVHHVYKVYFYGIYTYIFENLVDGSISREELSLVSQIINDEEYRRIIKAVFNYPLKDKRAEKTGTGEFAVILLSLIKWERAVLMVSRGKKCLKPAGNEPLVSIVIPVYNAEEYLEETLRHVSGQSYKNLEIICVDDGSSDNSRAILQNAKSKDLRFIILSQENQGAGTARNLGMDEAGGEYILFFDSDDILRKRAVQTLVKTAAKKDTDIVFFGYQKFIGRKRIHTAFSARELRVPMNKVISPAEIADRLFQADHGMPWNKFYKTEFLRGADVRFQALKNTNDEFFSRLTSVEAERILFLNRIFVDYRVGNKSSLQGNSGKNILDCTYALKAISGELKRRGIYETYCDTFKKLAGYVIMLRLMALKGSPEFDVMAREVYHNLLDVCEIDEQHLEKRFLGAYRALRAGDIARAESEFMAI